MGMPCVLASCPGFDATSFYRGYRPLAMLRQLMDMHIINVYEPGKVQWDILSLADIVFIQRPFSSEHLELAIRAKTWGIPIWIDFDDDLMHVPLSNPAFEMYRQPVVRDNITRILELCDVVTVTTNFLKKQITHKDIRVIPNAFDNYAFKREEDTVPVRKNIVWRGGPTHIKDLLIVFKQIVDTAHGDKNDWTWTFMGYNPFFLTENLPLEKTSFYPSLQLAHYFEALKKNAAGIQMVPLDPSDFNFSKSNIAYLEGTWAGSVVVCPDWEQWREVGAVNYLAPEKFQTALESVMAMDGHQIQKINSDAWKNIKDKYLLSNLNEMRKDLILEFQDKRRGECQTISKKKPRNTRTKSSVKLQENTSTESLSTTSCSV